jgi:UMF1 family MFS transporter
MTNFADPKQLRRARTAWALWGWGEHSYPTIIQTFIFATYIVSSAFLLPGQTKDDLALQLGIAVAIAGFVVAVVAPVIGQRSERSGRRKFWLLVNSGILIAIMVASYFVTPTPSMFVFGLVLYGLGFVVQEIALVNYYAMLKQVSTENNMARLSGYAWGLGYVGGIVMLVIALVGFYGKHPWIGGLADAENYRWMFLLSGVWMAIFTIPMAIWMPEFKEAAQPKLSIADSYRTVWRQVVSLRSTSPQMLRFLIASAIYRDGLAGVFTYGAILGVTVFGLSDPPIAFGIIASIVAGIGAMVGGFIDDKIGTKRTIVIALIGLIIAGSAVFIFAGIGNITFWVGGLALCLFVGPAQASSRTYMARMAPKGSEGQVFGLYQTTGEAGSYIVPALWVATLSIAKALGLPNFTLYGILAIVLVLIVGLVLLLRVDKQG